MRFDLYDRHVPPEATSIRVLSPDARRCKQETRPERMTCRDAADVCRVLEARLVGHLRRTFPKATVRLDAGADVSEALARLVLARTVFCSASTFCVYPALAAERAVVVNEGIYSTWVTPDAIARNTNSHDGVFHNITLAARAFVSCKTLVDALQPAKTRAAANASAFLRDAQVAFGALGL